MIYINFLFFIIAIVVFSSAQDTDGSNFSWEVDSVGALLVFAGFWFFNRWRFMRLKTDYDAGRIGSHAAKRFYSRTMLLNSVLAVVVFGAAVFLFDLKHLVRLIPFMGNSEFLASLIGVSAFAGFFSCTWYWGFRSFGSELESATSARRFVAGNIRFYAAIVVPWLLLSLMIDVLKIFDGPVLARLGNSALFQLGLLAVLLFSAALICPPLIVRLWECKPLNDKRLEDIVVSLARSQGARFNRVLSWNALNRSLITAAVFGILPFSRYLLITPPLVNLLDEDEIRAVMSHEIGHVKHRHLVLYFLFFVCFFTLTTWLIFILIQSVEDTRLGLELLTNRAGFLDESSLILPQIVLLLILFVLFFRFVFGFFMRNFERQADVYCFRTDVEPRHLLSSFHKLNDAIGHDREKKNWHHYTIAERIDFVERALKDPRVIARHHRFLRRRLILFFACVVAVIAMTAVWAAGHVDHGPDPHLREQVLLDRLQSGPPNAWLFANLAMVQNELERWSESKHNYERALALNPELPIVANNLAWLLLTCEDERLRDPERALVLAEAACAGEQVDFMLDTLAEAYFQNGRLDEALTTSQKAFDLSDKGDEHFINQLEKMRQAVEDREESN